MTFDRALGFRLAALAGAGWLAVASLPAWAALGGDMSSVAADGAHMRAQVRNSTSTAPGYSVQQLTLPVGTVVREYVTPAGTVFAVTWRGPSKPDLRELFGSYFQQYVDAASIAEHGAAARRHFEVRQSNLVVQSSGRMRAFHGRAYVPSLVPAGVPLSDIQ